MNVNMPLSLGQTLFNYTGSIIEWMLEKSNVPTEVEIFKYIGSDAKVLLNRLCINLWMLFEVSNE